MIMEFVLEGKNELPVDRRDREAAQDISLFDSTEDMLMIGEFEEEKT